MDNLSKYIAVVVFVAIAVGIGIWSRHRTKNVNEYFLGGRDLGPWLSSFAYGTTYFSAVAFIGFGGKVGWKFGISAMWIAVGNAIIGSLLAWLMLARRTRRMTTRLDAMTMPELFCERYKSKPMKGVSALIIFVFLVPYSASVYMGLTYLFKEAFGVEYLTALLFMSGVTAIYLVLGGYLAVARNDVVQGVVMILGSIAMVIALLRENVVGGLGNVDTNLHAVWVKTVAGAQAAGKPAPPTDFSSWFPPLKMETLSWDSFIASPLVALVALVLMTSLGVWGLPQMVHKFYAIKDERVIMPAMIMTTVFAFIISGAAFFAGSLVRLFITKDVLASLPNAGIKGTGAAAEVNYDLLVPKMLVDALPEALLVLIMLLILSASISTLSSLVLVSASVVTVDFTKGIVKPNISARDEVMLMRLFVCIFIIVSVILAQLKVGSIVTLMSISWGAVAGAFIGPYVWSLYMKRVNQAAAWVGMLGGLGICLGLNLGYIIKYDTATNGKYATLWAVLAMFGSLILVPLVSLLTKPMSDEHLERCYGDHDAVKAQPTGPRPAPPTCGPADAGLRAIRRGIIMGS